MKLDVMATYIGGPSVLLDINGIRLLTDPNFDPAGSTYTTPVYTLRKSTDPAIAATAIEAVDAVLLSHDHHFDNLDRAGKEFLSHASRTLAPTAAAERLGGNAVGLAPWQVLEVGDSDRGRLRVTATPARHGPPDGDRGPVIGFLLTDAEGEMSPHAPAIYVSGDTVWYEGVEEVARRADVRVAFLFMGAARVREVGPAHLTLTADEGVLVARAMPHATIVPLHFEGWQHFSEGRPVIQRAFDAAGLGSRLRWLTPGEPTTVSALQTSD
jgi:L-ascorbate metabolism protein UlaG (beta-lactamase superfamily)